MDAGDRRVEEAESARESSVHAQGGCGYDWWRKLGAKVCEAMVRRYMAEVGSRRLTARLTTTIVMAVPAVLAPLLLKYGVKMVLGSLINPDMGSLTAELFGALVETGNRLEERLGAIESQLTEVLDQRYMVAYGSGCRHVSDAASPERSPDGRANDLVAARSAFTEAAAASRRPLEAAWAERQIAVLWLAERNWTSAVRALERLEAQAVAALEMASRAHAHPADAVDVLMKQDPSITAWDRWRGSFDVNLKKTEYTRHFQREQQAAMKVALGLLEDSSAMARLMDLRVPATPVLFIADNDLWYGTELSVPINIGKPVTVAGFTCTVKNAHAVSDNSRTITWDCEAEVASATWSAIDFESRVALAKPPVHGSFGGTPGALVVSPGSARVLHGSSSQYVESCEYAIRVIVGPLTFVVQDILFFTGGGHGIRVAADRRDHGA